MRRCAPTATMVLLAKPVVKHGSGLADSFVMRRPSRSRSPSTSTVAPSGQPRSVAVGSVRTNSLRFDARRRDTTYSLLATPPWNAAQ
jgi:hypothetical protein